MFSKREVTSSVLEACKTKTTTYSVNLQRNRAVMETVSMRHRNCKRKTKQKGYWFVSNPSSLPTLSFSGSCTCTTTAAHKDCKNRNISALHFTDMLTSKFGITEHRIRALLVFQDGTSRNKTQVFIYTVANSSSTENMHWKADTYPWAENRLLEHWVPASSMAQPPALVDLPQDRLCNTPEALSSS